jgi:hypothetical protein
MEALSDTLAARVETLMQSHRCSEFHTTTGTEAAVEELGRRVIGLEKVTLELAAEVERLTARLAQMRPKEDEVPNGYSVSFLRYE